MCDVLKVFEFAEFEIERGVPAKLQVRLEMG